MRFQSYRTTRIIVPELDPPLILASASKRRCDLLVQIGLQPLVMPADINEIRQGDESALMLVARLALAKACAIDRPEAIIVGADTIVSQGERIFGKPADRQAAVSMLLELSATTHEVHTGVCVRHGSHVQREVVSSTVRFTRVTRSDAERYWNSGEPVDKAGGYALQGFGAVFVEQLVGSYSNVVGLPLFETAQMLQKTGIDLFSTC